MNPRDWKCPCGCGLQLTWQDLAKETKLIALLGSAPRAVNLRSVSPVIAARKEPPEPTTTGTCRSCGARMAIFTYLAESLKLRGAPWSYCDGCMQERAA